MIGMRINSAKTQLLLVRGSDGAKNAVVHSNDGIIESQDSLTVLGFTFHAKTDAAAHIETLERKFNERYWVIRNLKSAGWHTKDIMKSYNVLLRSVLEYSSATYHSLLSNAHKRRLETMQKRVLKLVYGWESDVEKIMEEQGISSLEERRKQRVLSFAKKCESNGRFRRRWFKTNTDRRTTRASNEYRERKHNTRRSYCNPIDHFTRVLNKEHRDLSIPNRWVAKARLKK
jgi:hypothetical protein